MNKFLASVPIALLLAIGTVSVARAAASHLDRKEVAEEDQRVAPLPRPLPGDQTIPGPGASLTATPGGAPDAFQLVGFTEASFDGARGVFSNTLACQREFSFSRVCTAEEIRRTVTVPASPGTGYAWVDMPTANLRSEGLPRRLPRDEEESVNCRGWKSSVTGDSGTAIDLNTMYGSLVSRSCEQSLRLACCAAMVQPASTCYCGQN